jgi:transcriptional regulator with XRE-family HTH domain
VSYRTPDELPRKLKSLRMNSGVSTRELARRTGMSQTKISRAENGTRQFRTGDVEAILDALDVRPSVRRALLRDSGSIQRRRAPSGEVGLPAGTLVTRPEYAELEASARQIVYVERDGLPLFLQSDAYIDYMFDFHRATGRRVDFMRDKVRRRDLSESNWRHDVCIIDEAILNRRPLSVRRWAEQLTRIEERLRKPGLELGVVLCDAEVPFPVGPWVCVDERSVLFESRGCPPVLVTERSRVEDRLSEGETLAKIAIWGGAVIDLIRSKLETLLEVDLREKTLLDGRPHGVGK